MTTPDLDSKLFCLNLDRRPDRRMRAWAQFKSQALKVDRVAAPDAALIADPRGWKSLGARACALGHRLAWRRARRTGANAAVFEDDVVLDLNFSDQWSALRIPEDWRIFYFGCTFRDVPEPIAEGVVRVRERTWETHAMVVHANLFPELHRLLAPYSKRKGRNTHRIATEIALDNLLAEIHEKEPVYAAYPALAWQSYGLSNIENGVRGLWTADGKQTTHHEVIAELDRRIANWRQQREEEQSK